jgi:hypothetical protein
METIQNVAKETVAFEKRYMVNMEAIALLTMAQDLSNTIKHISQIIQLTVGKYAQILTHAAMGTTSPYALPFSEVEGLSRALYMQKGLHLQTDLTKIRSRAIIHKNTLVLIFEIPVLSEAKQYNFYNSTPIQIFSQSEVHIPKLDAQYIAISKSGSKYYAMTVEEFRQCKTQPNKCYIRRPARPLNDKSSCTIISYTMDNLQCPVEKARHPEEYPPFFHVDGNRVIFAVNGSLTMYIKCQEH